MEKLRLTNDYVFKTIFGKKGNEEILKNLLIAILEIPIKEIELLHDVHLEREIEANKEGILDIQATLDFWIRFISNMKDGEVEKMKGEMSKETMEAIIKAEEEYEKVMVDPQAQRLIQRIKMARYDRMAGEYYARKTGMEEGMKEGMKKGIEKGAISKSIEIAKKMKLKGINVDEIIEITGLTKEEIEKI